MIETSTVAVGLTILGSFCGLIGGIVKIFLYFKGEISTLKDELQKELIKIADENAKFRLSAQKEIANLALNIEREFVRKNTS